MDIEPAPEGSLGEMDCQDATDGDATRSRLGSRVYDSGFIMNESQTDSYLETKGMPTKGIHGGLQKRGLAAKHAAQAALDAVFRETDALSADAPTSAAAGVEMEAEDGEDVADISIDDALNFSNDLLDEEPPDHSETNLAAEFDEKLADSRDGIQRPNFANHQYNLRELMNYNRAKHFLPRLEVLASKSEGPGDTHEHLQYLASNDKDAAEMFKSVPGNTKLERLEAFCYDRDEMNTVLKIFPEFDPADQTQWRDGAYSITCWPCVTAKLAAIMAGFESMGYTPTLGKEMIKAGRREIDLSDPIEAKSKNVRTLRLCSASIYMILAHYPGIRTLLREDEADGRIYAHPNFDPEIYKAMRYAISNAYWVYATIRDFCNISVDELVDVAYRGTFKMSEEELNSEYGRVFGPQAMKETLESLYSQEQWLPHVFGTGYGVWAPPTLNGLAIDQWIRTFAESGTFIWRAVVCSIAIMMRIFVENAVQVAAEKTNTVASSENSEIGKTVEFDVGCMGDIVNGSGKAPSTAASTPTVVNSEFNREYAIAFNEATEAVFKSIPRLWSSQEYVKAVSLNLNTNTGENRTINLQDMMRNLCTAAVKIGCPTQPMSGPEFLTHLCTKPQKKH